MNAMEYMVCVLDNAGHMAFARHIRCSGDEEAKERVQKMLDNHPLELWNGAKFLGRFDPHYRQAR
jgi:hypothetical protein